MMDTTTTSAKPTELQVLEDRIKVLTELNASVEKLRHAPSVLRLPSGSSLATNVLATPPATQLREVFAQLKVLSDTLGSEPAQEALRAARESEARDSGELALHNRRSNAKRTRPPSPESPQPSRTFQPEAPLLSFQPQEDPPLQRVGLVEYIKGYNRKRKDIRLNVWCPSTRPHDGALPSPAIIRFTIRDVLAVFLTLGYSVPDSTIIVEEATAFGTNEKKPPYSQSDFTVYQKTSQHLTKMLQAHPRISFQAMVMLLASYEDLFARPCTACSGMLSAEGHVPPVARVWVSSQEPNGGSWDARHPDLKCQQS